MRGNCYFSFNIPVRLDSKAKWEAKRRTVLWMNRKTDVLSAGRFLEKSNVNSYAFEKSGRSFRKREKERERKFAQISVLQESAFVASEKI